MALTKVKQRASGASRFVYTATAGQTTFSGADDNSQTLSYDIGFVDVYLNGVKMVNGTDVTVNNGTSVVFASGVALNDIVDINTFGTFDLASFDTSSITSGTLNTARLEDSSITNDKLATPGVVLQVLQTVKTDTFSYNTADTWGDITGLSVNITPVSTSSKILVSIDISCNTANLSYMKILRDSTDIAIGDADGSRVRSTVANINRQSDGNTTGNWSQKFLDSPSTTSQVTYKVQVYNETTNIFYLNRTESNGDSDVSGRPISTITVMEIAG